MVKRKLKRGIFGKRVLRKISGKSKTVATRSRSTGLFTGRRRVKKGERSTIKGYIQEGRRGRILGLVSKKKRRR